jgi:hypothetical protein
MESRRLLASLAAVLTLAVVPGCTRENIDAVLGTCPSNPAESGGINWTPDVGRPVFWGVQDLTVSAGAPRDMQIFYPTFEGFTDIEKVDMRAPYHVHFEQRERCDHTGVRFLSFHDKGMASQR